MGTVVYHYLEGWSWIDSLYFSIITLTTIGYGIFRLDRCWRLFTIGYILLGIGVILGFISRSICIIKVTKQKPKSKSCTGFDWV